MQLNIVQRLSCLERLGGWLKSSHPINIYAPVSTTTSHVAPALILAFQDVVAWSVGGRSKASTVIIPFTQFLRPNGMRRTVLIDRAEAVGKKAKALQNRGCRFEIEELNNGIVSMTVELRGSEDDGPIAHRLVPNGPMVPEVVDALIQEAYERLAC